MRRTAPTGSATSIEGGRRASILHALPEEQGAVDREQDLPLFVPEVPVAWEASGTRLSGNARPLSSDYEAIKTITQEGSHSGRGDLPPHSKPPGLATDRVKVVAAEGNRRSRRFGGDQIKTLGGQPLLSIADVQWVLHHTPATGAKLSAEVIRDGKPLTLTLALGDGWRQADDISWRASAWGLRRMTTGGMFLEQIEERPDGVPTTGMALRAKHVGAFGPHAAAKNAGFQAGDIIISYDGKTDLLRETDLFAYSLRSRKVGDKVTIKFVHGKTMELAIPMQDASKPSGKLSPIHRMWGSPTREGVLVLPDSRDFKFAASGSRAEASDATPRSIAQAFIGVSVLCRRPS